MNFSKILKPLLLDSLRKQFEVQLPEKGDFLLAESVQPVVDLSRPSKIPYTDWIAGGGGSTGTLIAAKANHRIVLVHYTLHAYNLATGTGTVASIEAPIRGVLNRILYHAAPASAASNNHMELSGELVVDENQPVTSVVTGAWDSVWLQAIGYYIHA